MECRILCRYTNSIRRSPDSYFTKKERKMQTCYLAVDIGASSGRHIIGTVEHGVMALHEVYRFENRLIEKNGHLCWDMEGLVQNVIEG